MEAQLYDPANRPVFAAPLRHEAEPILDRRFESKVLEARTPQRGSAKFAWLEGEVGNPRKWTAETPVLYTLVSGASARASGMAPSSGLEPVPTDCLWQQRND